MSDESAVPEKVPQKVSKKGQTMVIYLPEGAVIIDRTDVTSGALPADDITENMRPNRTREPIEHRVREQGLDWLHTFNMLFIAFIALVALFPTMLSTYFGTAVYASSSSSVQTSIYRGDLMVSKIVPASTLKVGDVLLLRNEFSWDFEVRQVTVSSTASGGDLTTIATETEVGATSSDSYTLDSATRVHKITSVIPKLGDATIILTSIPAKIGIGISLLALNVIVHVRRTRRRRIA
ncbi:MAG: hypothetical protein Q8L08_04025 [Candidatus Nanopelagicaceae bacterium]|nr:hypothetical protein [Candidatus Nanopelagicaceae bacterium]